MDRTALSIGNYVNKPVQDVQTVPIVQAPSFILPRDAGEERGEGLNGAKRLNGLNVWNFKKI
jgi:hypothetical protein